MSSHTIQTYIGDLNARRALGASRRRPYLPEADGFTPSHLPYQKQNGHPFRDDRLFMVREAGLEVAVPNFNNFLVSNYVINSSETDFLCTIQSIKFMWSEAVKGQICGQEKPSTAFMHSVKINVEIIVEILYNKKMFTEQGQLAHMEEYLWYIFLKKTC